jgi:hypothetical protein
MECRLIRHLVFEAARKKRRGKKEKTTINNYSLRVSF